MNQSKSFDRILLPRGAMLFHEGDVASDAYVIQSGRIEIFLPKDGQEQVLATRGAGEILGEMALVDSKPRSASARVIEDCDLFVVTADRFSVRLAEADPVLRVVLGVVLSRYRDTIQALGGASSGERNTPEVLEVESSASAFETLKLEQELRRAVEQRELVMFFQPIVRMQTGRLAGFEALLRWRHPVRGLVPPGLFIPIAEATGLVSDLTNWMLAELSQVMPELMMAALANVSGVEQLFLSINISGRDIARPGFAHDVAKALATANIQPSSIKLEVTETMLMNDPTKAASVLDECRQLGLGIALDDFGTGYSSLGQLAQFPIMTLKLDQSFIRAMETDASIRKIVNAVLRLADELDMPVVAEGIETESMAAMLTSMNCIYGQGYLFSRPAPLAETTAMIRAWKPIIHHVQPASASNLKAAV